MVQNLRQHRDLRRSLAQERVIHDLRGDLQVDVVEAEDLVPLGEVVAAGSTDGRRVS
jgi:hypothetical protein